MFVIYAICAMIYGGVGLFVYLSLIKSYTLSKTTIIALLAVAMTLHGYLLSDNILTLYGLNLNLFNTLSLISLFFLLFFLLFSLYRPILSLGILAAPTALIGVSLGYFGHSPYAPINSPNPLLSAHIILSFAAYCVLLMSAVQAIMLRLQIRELKHHTIHRFWVNKLPPLQSMESLLFDMILMGFVLLSVALTLGFVSTYDILAQHIAHKLVFSSLSWLVFGWLIVGHYRYGWHGKRATNFTLYGFILLAIGFVGSKAVLELILGK